MANQRQKDFFARTLNNQAAEWKIQRIDDPNGQDPNYPIKIGPGAGRLYVYARSGAPTFNLNDDGPEVHGTSAWNSSAMAAGDWFDIACPWYKFTLTKGTAGLGVISIYDPTR